MEKGVAGLPLAFCQLLSPRAQGVEAAPTELQFSCLQNEKKALPSWAEVVPIN
jgi:hypothetical protein